MVELPDSDHVVTEDRVRHRDVEEEVRQREVQEIIAATERSGTDLDRLCFAAGKGLRVDSLQEGYGFAEPFLQFGKRFLRVLEAGRLDAG